MTETAVETSTPAATKSKKSATPKVPKAKSATKKAAASHPPTAQMVNAAIKSLKERGGSSLQAIKKYISTTYKVDAEKVAPFIKKYLKSSVDNGSLIRTKGKGASGSFKLAVAKTEGAKKPAAKKPKTAAKKAVKPKKEKATAKPKAAKPKATKPKAAAKKSPSKAKKATKAPAAKKPKSPKPKKVAVKKVAKKPAAKK